MHVRIIPNIDNSYTIIEHNDSSVRFFPCVRPNFHSTANRGGYCLIRIVSMVIGVVIVQTKAVRQ